MPNPWSRMNCIHYVYILCRLLAASASLIAPPVVFIELYQIISELYQNISELFQLISELFQAPSGYSMVPHANYAAEAKVILTKFDIDIDIGKIRCMEDWG